MVIQHNQLKSAIVHLAKKLQKKNPEYRYWLTKAQVGGNGWTVIISRKKESPMDSQPLPPPVVNFDELTDEDDDSLENIVIDTDNITQSLEAADGFVRRVNNIVTAKLFSIIKLADSWRITYFAKNIDGKDIVITLQISIDGTIASQEIDIVP